MDHSDYAHPGVSTAQPNYFNLFENNVISECQNVFKNVAFNTAGEPIQPDVAIFNATWRNNQYSKVSGDVITEGTSYSSISIEQSLYDNNVEVSEIESP